MREILFRGKRQDNGDWVEGYYAKAKYIISGKALNVIFSLDLEAFPHCEFSGYENVAPSTIGQYTGLKDKNGRRIFEGDIVRVDLEEPTLACLVGEIYFTNGCYMIRPVSRVLSLYAYHPYCTVIGNIFDNPELLEEEANHV